MEPFALLSSTALLLLAENVDTDQIIPARFLTTTERRGLGVALFADWRYDSAGAPTPGFPLNAAEASTARILVVGRNFGCGSSREHAPWALTDFGFRAVVGTSFADIFRANALKNGLLPVCLSPEEHADVCRAVHSDPGAVLDIDLATQELRVQGGVRCAFAIAPFAKRCLLEGADELAFLIGATSDIAAYEASSRMIAAPDLSVVHAPEPAGIERPS